MKLSIRVITKNPKLQTVLARKTEAEYFVDKIVGVVKLPDPPQGEPPTQVLTMGGPLDCYDTYEEVLAKLGNRLELN